MRQVTDIDVLQSRVIDGLRFPLAVAIIFIHSFGEPEVNVSDINWSSITGMDVYNLLRILFSHVISHLAVPSFFLISGYLFFFNLKQWNKSVYLSKIRKRLRTLLIPYILWNLIPVLIVICIYLKNYILKGESLSGLSAYFEANGWWHMFWDCNRWGERVNMFGMSNFMTGPVNLPLWFLRDLIVVSLCTPFIYWLIKRIKGYGIVVLGTAYLFRIWPSVSGLTITSLFFFSMGAYLSINRKNIIEEFGRLKYPAYVSAFIIMIIMTIFDGSNTYVGYRIYPFFIVIGVCALFNLATKSVGSKKYRKSNAILVNSAFFIYASHWFMILGKCQNFVEKLIPWNTPFALIGKYMLIPLVTAGLCLIIYCLMKRVFPKTLNILTGSRT